MKLIITAPSRVVEYKFVCENLPPPPGRVLDVGCVGSNLPQWLAERGYQVWAIDVNPFDVDESSVKFVRGDIRGNSFPPNFFDIVTAVSTIEHVGLGYYGDPKAEDGDLDAMREIHRILKLGGALLLTVPYGKEIMVESRLTFVLPAFRLYCDASLSRLLEGFKMVKEEYYRDGAWTEWRKVSKEEASGVVSDAHSHSLVCLKLLKEEMADEG